jgi:hypothetical protein
VEHKIETLVGAPAAVEEALASLIVDNQDKYHALQYRALVTYIKRLYFPFLMCEPQVDQHDAVLTATWMFQVSRAAGARYTILLCTSMWQHVQVAHGEWSALSASPSGCGKMLFLPVHVHVVQDQVKPAVPIVLPFQMLLSVFILILLQDPRLAQTEHRRQSMGAFLVLPSLRDLPAGLKIAGAAVNGLASQAQVDPSGSTLHIAVCNGSDALAGATGAGRLLRNDANLLGADAKEITGVVAAAIKEATPLLSAMKVGTVSVLAAAALMPVRNGFVWDEAAGAFKVEPCLQQVSWVDAAADCLARCRAAAACWPVLCQSTDQLGPYPPGDSRLLVITCSATYQTTLPYNL